MCYRANVTDTLAQVLRIGDTIILNTPNALRVTRVRESIEADGAEVLDLPPDSPDFNPIERIFAKNQSSSSNRCITNRSRYCRRHS